MLRSIECKNIWKFYDDTPVLKNITYEFVNGKLYFLKGFNGSGKTTLLSVLVNMINSDEGNIVYHYNDSGKSSDAPDMWQMPFYIARADDAGHGMYPFLSISENLDLLLNAYNFKNCTSREIHSCKKNEVNRLIESFKLEDIKNKPLSELSRGYLQRAILARVFLNPQKENKAWIVLDEPSTFLDDIGFECLLSMLNSLINEGNTFIIATHDSSLISSIDESKSEFLSMNSGRLN